MSAALVTGANRGLGLGLVRHLLAKDGGRGLVFAGCRNPDRAQELQELQKTSKNLHILKLDVTDFDSFPDISKRIGEIAGDGLNLLINNAGVSTKFTSINLVKVQQLIENFTVNTVGPIMLTKSLLPLLKTASQKNSHLPMGSRRACVLNMTSILGSIELNDKGGFYPYRCSKSALNAATRSMSVDMKKDKIIAVAMHPGWVQTEMGGRQAPIDVETSIAGVMKTLDELGEDDSGCFYQYDGQKLPW